MKVLVVEPMKECYTKEINGLEEMQALVGGYIQAIYPFPDKAAVVCNEEGKNLGLPFNRPLLDENDLPYDIICGTFFVAGLGVEDFVSLTEEQIRRYKEHYDNYGKFEWYAYRPTEADYETVRQAVGRYLDVFRDRTLERTRNGPKLVYICAPLRGDVEQNITFAKEKAREVFQAGDIPICPHLMFPPFADPDDPVQDQAAREMGLRLVEHCQQVNVYGPVRTPGMLAEIRRAEELRIPVKADQPGLQKTKGRPRRGQSR